jgi:hypothetical protein
MPEKLSELGGEFYRSMQHHLKDLLWKDGVYERREPVETLSHAENRDLEPLEGRASRQRSSGLSGRYMV